MPPVSNVLVLSGLRPTAALPGCVTALLLLLLPGAAKDGRRGHLVVGHCGQVCQGCEAGVSGVLGP